MPPVIREGLERDVVEVTRMAWIDTEEQIRSLRGKVTSALSQRDRIGAELRAAHAVDLRRVDDLHAGRLLLWGVVASSVATFAWLAGFAA